MTESVPVSDFSAGGKEVLEYCGGEYRLTIVDRPSRMLLDLTFKRSGLMIPCQFAERWLVKRLQHVGEFIGFPKSRGKIRAVDPT